MVCCFLGHRDAPDLLNELTMTIEELIINHSADIFFVGTHGNFDKQVAYILDKMKSIYPHIVYNIVLAYLPVEKKENVGIDYSHAIYPDGIGKVPPRFAISYRNKWMINQSDTVVTYIRHITGGAAQFAQYAKKHDKIMVEL